MTRPPNICSTRTSPPARSRPLRWSRPSAGAPTPKSQAYRKGFAAGQAQAQGEASAPPRSADRRRAGRGSTRALTGIETRLETEAVEVAVAVAGKLAPELIAREPFAEISALATECFHHLVTTPHVVVRIGADIYETGQGQARGDRARARLRGPAGGAARAGDGARRLPHRMGRWRRRRATSAATLAAIDDVVGRYVAAPHATASSMMEFWRPTR